jgi:uncharacterized membrane protein
MAEQKAPTTVAHGLYILHVLAPFTLWTLALIAVIFGAINRSSVQGTWVESHYQWLSSTFWRGIGLVIVLTVIFFLSIIGILFIWLLWFGLTVWYLWRVIKGWMRLFDGKPAPT